MTRLLGRTRSLGVLAAVAALAAGGVAPADAAELQEQLPVRVFAHPVAPDRAVIAVDAGTREELTTAEVRDRSGERIGRAILRSTGKALVPLTLPRGSEQKVEVTLTNGTAEQVTKVTTSVTLSTKPAALRQSPWRVVNKLTPLGSKDAPAQKKSIEGVPLEPRAAGALAQLLARAEKQKVDLYPSNGYRAYGWQKGLYQSYVRSDGKKKADRYSARPGYSEHQTGLAFDAKTRAGTCDLQACFGKTAAGRFLARYAGEAGYLIRYTAENRPVTGYRPEPWHLRYVGVWLTGYLQETDQKSLEDAFAMAPAPSYRG